MGRAKPEYGGFSLNLWRLFMGVCVWAARVQHEAALKRYYTNVTEYAEKNERFVFSGPALAFPRRRP